MYITVSKSGNIYFKGMINVFFIKAYNNKRYKIKRLLVSTKASKKESVLTDHKCKMKITMLLNLLQENNHSLFITEVLFRI